MTTFQIVIATCAVFVTIVVVVIAVLAISVLFQIWRLIMQLKLMLKLAGKSEHGLLPGGGKVGALAIGIVLLVLQTLGGLLGFGRKKWWAGKDSGSRRTSGAP